MVCIVVVVSSVEELGAGSEVLTSEVLSASELDIDRVVFDCVFLELLVVLVMSSDVLVGIVLNPFVDVGCTVTLTVVVPGDPGHRALTTPPDRIIPSSEPEVTLRSPQAPSIVSAAFCSPATQLAEHRCPSVKSLLLQPSMLAW